VTSQPTSGDIAQIGFHILGGSRHQDQDNGTAFLLKRLTATTFISPFLNISGNQFNSYTNRDHTSFILTCPKRNIDNVLPVFGGLFQTNILPDLLEAEKSQLNVFRNEISQNIPQILFDHLHAFAYQGSSLGYSVLGNSDTNLTVEAINDFRSKNYTAPRILISGAGIDSHEKFVEQANQHFSFIPNNPGLPPSNARFVGGLVNIRDDYLPKVHILYAVEVSASSLPSQLCLQILQAAFGNWRAEDGAQSNTISRLGETLALENLGERAESFLIPYAETGLLGIYGITSPENLEDFSVEVLSEFVRVSQKLSTAEIERAKRTVRSAIIQNNSTTSGVLETISRQVWDFGPRFELPEILKIIDDLPEKEVRRVASALLYDVDPVIVAMGPTTTIPDYNRMRSWMYWNRF